MGVIVTGRDYENEYRPESVNWLLGNTGDWQRLTIVSRFGVERIITMNSPLQIGIHNSIIAMDGKSWSEFGFDVGDEIHIEYDINLYDLETNTVIVTFHVDRVRNITYLQGEEIRVDGGDMTKYTDAATDSGMLTMLPMTDGALKFYNVIVWSDKQPEGVIIEYGHLENSEADSYNLSSFIDGTISRLGALNTDVITSWTSMFKMGLQSGMAIRSASWQFWNKIGTHHYQYAFVIEFMLASFFEDLSNFELRQAPTNLFDAKSLTDNFKITGFPKWNNPNTVMQNDMKGTKRLGNTGWFDENFNGLDNDFVIKSVTYHDVMTNAPLDGLSYGSAVRVSAIIGGIDNLSDGLSKFGLGFIWLPEEEDYYKNKETSFHDNLLVNTAGGFNSGVFPLSNTVNTNTYQGFSFDSLIRMDVKDIIFKQQGNDVIYEATFVPTAGFKNFIDSLPETDRNYALWVSCADRTLVTNFSNRVSLLLDYSKMELFVPPVGEWEPMGIGFYEHPEDGSEAIGGKCGEGEFFVEDDILAKVDFLVDITDDIPDALEFAIELENTVTGIKHKLQNYNVDLSQFPTDGQGVPQWDYDESRGFKYESGNNKNWIKVQRNPLADSGSNYGYVAYYGFKIRWEDWLNRTGMPADFFDANLENNGFNNDWFEKMNHAGWKMQFTVYTSANLDGSPVKYVNSQSFVVKDYNSNTQIDKEWNFYRHSDNTLLNAGIDSETGQPLGILLQNEQVRVEVIWTRLSGTWSSLDEVYGTICIEVDKGAGQMEFRQLSSIWGSESDNPLIPLEGETRLKLTLVAPNVIKAECLVEPSLLIEATRYKHSARIGCKKGDVDKKDYFIFTNQEEIIDTFGEKFIIAQQ